MSVLQLILLLGFMFIKAKHNMEWTFYIPHRVLHLALLYMNIFYSLAEKEIRKSPIHNSFKEIEMPRTTSNQGVEGSLQWNFNMKKTKLKKTLEDEKSFHAHGLAEIGWKKWLNCQK